MQQAVIGMIGNEYTVDWSPHMIADWTEVPVTRLEREEAATLASAITRVPAGFKLHPRVARIVTDREKMAAGEIPMDWGFAELMAYGSILRDGFKVRLTGQDSRRGTFFHRHAALHDQATGRSYVSLDDIDTRRGSQSPSPIRCCRKRPCSVSSTATRRPIPRRW